jgi:hypothetical protein
MSSPYTKAELYGKIVQMQKTTAQGVPGTIFRMSSQALYDQLQELVAEGRLKVYTDVSTSGMFPSEEWFYPTEGYSIWNADRDQQMQDMLCARYHLDMLDEDSKVEPSRTEFEANPELMLMYKTWLELHKEELETLANLSEEY